MTNPIIPDSHTLIDLFTDVDINDSEAVASVIKGLKFNDLSHQSVALQSLREDLDITISDMTRLLYTPSRTVQRFIFGETAMKPVILRTLALTLLLRHTNPALFNELLGASGDRRRRTVDH